MIPVLQVHIGVPYAKAFDDYHDIDAHAEAINGAPIEGLPLKAYECGFDGHNYIGLFYIGRRPLVSEIKEIVQRDCEISDDIEWSWNRIRSKIHRG